MLKNLNHLTRIKSLLSLKQQKELYFFIILFLIAAFLETIGISLVIPVLNVLSQENPNFSNYPFLNKINLNEISKNELLIISVFLLMCVYTFKVLFLSFLAYKETKFLAGIKSQLSKKIFSIYLNNSYSFHLQTNSAQLIRDIIDIRWIMVAVKAFMLIFTETILLIFIGILLLIYEPRGAIFSSVFLGSFGFIFYKTIQIKAAKWGKERQLSDGLRMMFMKEGFGALKEIKVMGREAKFVNNFYEQSYKGANNEQKQSFILDMPRLWLEWLSILGIVLLILFLFKINNNYSSLIPVIGLFAAAAYRIMPSISRIMVSKQNLQFAGPVIEKLHDEVQNSQLHKNQINGNPKGVVIKDFIEIKKLTFKYPKAKKILFSNLDFKIKCGSAVGIVGDSGAGKTTLINIILGLLKPESGHILSDGKIIHDELRSWQDQLGYVPQNIYLTDDTLKNNIALGIPDEKIDDQLITNALVSARIDKFVHSLDGGVNTKVGELGERLSGGQRQRIGIARAIYNNPKVLILDEATNSLDKETENEILNEVNLLKRKKTLIIVSHNHETLSNCDIIFKVADESIKKVFDKSEVQKI